MENKERRSEQDQLEAHSIPGTNQAGKGPEPCEEADPKNRPDHERQRQHDDGLEEHSLPGTNQAGKGPNCGERND